MSLPRERCHPQHTSVESIARRDPAEWRPVRPSQTPATENASRLPWPPMKCRAQSKGSPNARWRARPRARS